MFLPPSVSLHGAQRVFLKPPGLDHSPVERLSVRLLCHSGRCSNFFTYLPCPNTPLFFVSLSFPMQTSVPVRLLIHSPSNMSHTLAIPLVYCPLYCSWWPPSFHATPPIHTHTRTRTHTRAHAQPLLASKLFANIFKCLDFVIKK